MVTKTLLQAGAAVGPGPIQNFPQSHPTRTFQFNPVASGFSGSVTIETSYAASPGNNDFQTAVTVTFTAHKDNFKLDVAVDAPWVRARMVASNVGTISVFGTSKTGGITGGTGTTLASATAVVSSAYQVGVTGTKVHVTAPVVPAITSDDVAWSLDPVNRTVTDEIVDLKAATGYSSSAADIDLLEGLAAGTGACTGILTAADFCKLGTTSTLSELNHLSGVSSNVQGQLDAKADGTGVDLTGWTTNVGWVNSFFDASPTITVSQLSTSLTGLTASAADLNTLTGTAGSFTAADLTKLGLITASASEINSLTGFTGTSTDLNKLSGLTASTVDLNAINGLAGTGVTTTEIQYLSGLTQNVQAALTGIPNLAGLTSAVSDLNLLDGASTATNGYSGVISKAEINALDGVTSSIQTQLNAKRDIATCIGIGEICGASITITEMNYSQGLVGNIQAQIDALTLGSITTAGGTFTGPIFIANGTAANPGLGYQAPNNDTGLYLEGAPGIGMSVAGVRAWSLDGNDMRVGDNLVNGQPLLRHAAPSATNPTYAFVGDEDTGLHWGGSADSLALAIGTDSVVEAAVTPAPGVANVNLGGPVAANYSVGVSGVLMGEKAVSRTLVQAGTGSGSTGTTPLYTVPVGRTLVVTKIMLVLATVTAWGGSANPLRMNLGFAAPLWDQYLDNITNTTVLDPVGYSWGTGAGQIMPLGMGDNPFTSVAAALGAAYGVASPGQVVTANVTALANATDWDMEVIVFGYEY